MQQYESWAQISAAQLLQEPTSAAPWSQILCSQAEAPLLEELLDDVLVVDFELLSVVVVVLVVVTVVAPVEDDVVEVLETVVETVVELAEPLPEPEPLPVPALAARSAPFGVPSPVGPS